MKPNAIYCRWQRQKPTFPGKLWAGWLYRLYTYTSRWPDAALSLAIAHACRSDPCAVRYASTQPSFACDIMSSLSRCVLIRAHSPCRKANDEFEVRRECRVTDGHLIALGHQIAELAV